MPDTPSPDDKFRAIEQASFTFAQTEKRSLIDGIIAESKVQSARHKPVRDTALAFLKTVDEFKAVEADDPKAAEKKAEIMGRMETTLGTFGDKLKSPALKKAVQDLLASDTFSEKKQAQPGLGNVPRGNGMNQPELPERPMRFPGLPSQGTPRPAFPEHDEGGNHTPDQIVKEFETSLGRGKSTLIDAVRVDAGNNATGFRAPALHSAAVDTVLAYEELKLALKHKNRPGMEAMIDAAAERLEQNFDNYAQHRGGGDVLKDLMKKVNHQPGYKHPDDAKKDKYTTDSPEYGRLVMLTQAEFTPTGTNTAPGAQQAPMSVMGYVQQAVLTPGRDAASAKRREAAEEVLQAYRLALDVRNHADEPWSQEAATSTMEILQSSLENFAKQRGNDRNFTTAVTELLKSDDFKNPAQYLERQRQQHQREQEQQDQRQKQEEDRQNRLRQQQRRPNGGFRSSSADAPPSDEMLAAVNQFNESASAATTRGSGNPDDVPNRPFMRNGPDNGIT